MVLEITKIVSKEEDSAEAPKVLDYAGVSKMRYFRDSNGDYYYLEESGRKLYDDEAMEFDKDPYVEAAGCSSSSSSLSSNLKPYLDELVRRISTDNQIMTII